MVLIPGYCQAEVSVVKVAKSLSEASGQTKSSESTIRKLRDYLFTNYDMAVRPVSHHDNTTEVEIGLTPIHITQLDETSGILTMECWISMHWQDDHLSWDPTKFAGQTILRISDREVWKPDIAAYNGRGNNNMPWSSVNVLVNSSGFVWWIPPASVQIVCGISNYYGYPQDTQECPLILGSWTHDANGLNLQIQAENVSLSDYHNAANPHWELTSVTGKRNVMYYSCCPEPYVSLTYALKLKRTNVPFAALCTTPDTVARVLILCMFWIWNGTRKLLLGCTTLVILAAIAVGITATLPSPAAATAALAKVNSAFALCVSAMIVEIVVVSLYTCGTSSPSCLDRLGSSTFCQLLVPCKPVEHKEELLEESSLSKPNNWPFLAGLIDRVAFLVFSVLLLAL